MSKKKLTYIALSILAVLSVAFFINITDRNNSVASIGSDSAIFPQIICVAIVILCIASFIETLKSEDEKIAMSNMKMVVLTIVLAFLYLFIWTKLELFYVGTTLYVFVLYVMYTEDKKNIKKLLKVGVPITFGTVLIIYLFFEKAMMIKF